MPASGATMENQLDASHVVGHGLSLLAILGSLAGYIPAVAAFAGFIWYLVQLYESKTVQHWVRNRRERKVAALRVRVAALDAALAKSAMEEAKERGKPLPDLPDGVV